MLSALALVAFLVKPGGTLSGVASAHNASLAAVETANSQIHDLDLILAGKTVKIPAGPSAAHAPHAKSTHTAAFASRKHKMSSGSPSANTSSTTAQLASTGSSGYSSSNLSDIPGVPSSFAACVAFRESTNLQNPAANGNAYGIIPASGYNVYGTSIAHQKQVFAELYKQYGGSPWAADGCPGS